MENSENHDKNIKVFDYYVSNCHYFESVDAVTYCIICKAALSTIIVMERGF